MITADAPEQEHAQAFLLVEYLMEPDGTNILYNMYNCTGVRVSCVPIRRTLQ